MPIINMVYKKKKGWKPGANTLGYRPLKTDGNEASGKTGMDMILDGVTFSGGYATFSGSRNSRFPSTISGVLTTSMWVKRTTNNYSFFLSGNAYDQIGFGFWYQSGYIACYGWDVGPMPKDTWCNVILTINGNTKKVYLNGTLLGSAELTAPSGLRYRIGCKNSNDGKFVGMMGEMIFEDKVRTAEEILDYYNQTKANYGL